jgi:hypothetical protein
MGWLSFGSQVTTARLSIHHQPGASPSDSPAIDIRIWGLRLSGSGTKRYPYRGTSVSSRLSDGSVSSFRVVRYRRLSYTIPVVQIQANTAHIAHPQPLSDRCPFTGLLYHWRMRLDRKSVSDVDFSSLIPLLTPIFPDRSDCRIGRVSSSCLPWSAPSRITSLVIGSASVRPLVLLFPGTVAYLLRAVSP